MTYPFYVLKCESNARDMLVIKQSDFNEALVHLNCITLILLVISQEIVSQIEISLKPEYYFLDEGEAIKTKDFRKISGKLIGRIVIDLLVQHYITHVKIFHECKISTFSVTSLSCYKYFSLITFVNIFIAIPPNKVPFLYKEIGSASICTMYHSEGFAEMHFCNKLARIIVLEGEAKILNLILYGHGKHILKLIL